MIAESKSNTYEAASPEPYCLKKMIVAHDASPASEKALQDAVALARRFQAELILAHVQSPFETEDMDEGANQRREHREAESEVKTLADRLTAKGLQSRSVVRAGAVGDMLFNLCCEEEADLLLLGAYGRGNQDRQTLGSTAEQLLRGLPCPVLTYGPNVSSSVIPADRHGPVLLPVSLPCSSEQLLEGISLLKLFGKDVEIFHVDRVLSRHVKRLEQDCSALSSFIQSGGVQARSSFLYGEADRAICSEAKKIESPFILMPLKWRKGLSAPDSDNVAARVIRLSTVPVLTYRCD